MNLKKTIQEDHNQLDFCRRQLAIATVTKNREHMAKLQNEINSLNDRIENSKKTKKSELSTKAQRILKMNFHRVISKKEQADIGRLKKSVRGLMLVHPMTTLGKEIGLMEVTGYAFKPF